MFVKIVTEWEKSGGTTCMKKEREFSRRSGRNWDNLFRGPKEKG